MLSQLSPHFVATLCRFHLVDPPSSLPGKTLYHNRRVLNRCSSVSILGTKFKVPDQAPLRTLQGSDTVRLPICNLPVLHSTGEGGFRTCRAEAKRRRNP